MSYKYILCLGSAVDGDIENFDQEQKYGIEPVGGHIYMGDRVCDRHQNISNLMSSLNFS